MEENNLTPVQQRLLSILKWFHGFCVQNNLRYYCIGGTLLGAVRHKGFIPWDDDVDVGMPRKDYAQLLKLTKNKTFGNFVVESYENGSKDYVYGYAKAYDTTTTLVESLKKPLVRGLYVDIFPLDGAGETEAEASYNFRKIDFLKRILYVSVSPLSRERKLYKNLATLIANALPDCLISAHKIIKIIENLCTQKDFDSSKYAGNLLGSYAHKEIVLQSVFGKPTLYDFEDIKIFGVQNYDEYLTHVYGDYMQPPPLEKRKSTHVGLRCNLFRSYLKNAREKQQ